MILRNEANLGVQVNHWLVPISGYWTNPRTKNFDLEEVDEKNLEFENSDNFA